MIRKAYIKPESLLIPFCTEDLMGIGGSAGTNDVFGKQTDFEEESDDDGDIWGFTTYRKDIWGFTTYRNSAASGTNFDDFD